MDPALALSDEDEEERKRRMMPGGTDVTPAALPEAALPEKQPALALVQPDQPAQAPQGLQYVNPSPPVVGVDPLAKPEPPVSPPEKPEPVGGTLTPDQLALAATVPQNPNGDDVDKLLAANPVAPKEPPRPPRPPVDLSSSTAIKGEQSRIYNEQIAAADDAAEAERKIGAARVEQAKAEQDAANTQAAVAADNEKRQQQAIAQANDRTQAYADRAATERDKYMSMDLHDYWADKSTGNKVLAGLSILFGAVGRTSNESNPGLKIVNDAIERDFRLQQARIDKQKSNMQAAQGEYEMGLTQKQAALADNNVLKSAAYEKISAQLVAAKMKQGATLEQAQSDKDVLGLQEKRDAALQDTLTAVHSQNIQDANEKINQERADAYRKYMGRGKGGGAGGGAGAGDALSQFIDKASALKPGESISPELAKLGLQAHLKPNQIATEVEKYRNSAAKSDKLGGAAGLAGEKQGAKEVESWAKENGLPGIAKKQQELSSTLEEIKNAPHNPMQQALAIEKAVSSARGGSASKTALELALHHLGPQYTGIDDLKRAIVSKEIGEKQMENFVGFMNNQLGTAQKEGHDKYEAFNKYIESQPPEKRAMLEGQRGRIFSGLAGFGGQSQSAASAKIARAKAILADPAKKAALSDQELARVVQISQGG